MSFQLTGTRFKAFTDAGAPLVGGRVYTFASGTTTFKTVYSDATLTSSPTYTNDGTGALYITLDARGECDMWLGSGAYTIRYTTAAGVTIDTVDGVVDPQAAADSGLKAFYASTDNGKGASAVGTEDAAGVLASSNVEGALQEVAKAALSIASFVSNKAVARAGFQAAASTARTLGIGTIRVPKGVYVFDTNSEATCINATNVRFECEPGVEFQYGYYDKPLFYWVGSAGGGMVGRPLFTFTGTRPGSAAGLTATLGGWDGTGVLSPPDLACHVAVLGSDYVDVDIRWQGSTTSNRKEGGILAFGGNSSGPSLDGGTAALPGSNAVYSKGNRFNFHSDDVAIGLAMGLQDRFWVGNVTSDRYWVDAFVGPGHVIYQTGMCKNGSYEGGQDASTPIHTPGSGTYTGGCSWQFRSLVNCTLGKFDSKRPEGSHAIFNQCTDNNGGEFAWSADRYPYEAGLASGTVCTVINGDATSIHARNRWGKWRFVDQKNAGASRSSNCAIMGSSGGTYIATNTYDNSFDIEIVFSPDGSYNKGCGWLHGQNNQAKFLITNNGTGAFKSGLLLYGDAAGSKVSGNVVDLTLAGTGIQGYQINAQNSNGDNVVKVHGSGNIRQSGSGLASTDKVVMDDDIYCSLNPGSITPDCQLHRTIIVNLSSTGTTMAAPANPYTGARLKFLLVQDGTGGRVVTWNAAFKKAADGAGAANASGITEFVYNGTNWIQQGGALAYY